MNRLIIIAVTIVSIFAGDRSRRRRRSERSAAYWERRTQRAAATHGHSASTRPSFSTRRYRPGQLGGWAAGRLEVTFKDNTRVTLGENAKLTLDQYAFNPTSGRRKIRFRVVVSSSNEYYTD
jgi:hypothetical protein